MSGHKPKFEWKPVDYFWCGLGMLAFGVVAVLFIARSVSNYGFMVDSFSSVEAFVWMIGIVGVPALIFALIRKYQKDAADKD